MGVLATADILMLGLIPEPGLLFGLMLVAALVGGYSARWVRVPRVVGYLLAGIGLRFVLHWLLDPDATEQNGGLWAAAEQTLQPIKDLALGLILFSIGGVFESRRLKSVGSRMFRISLSETVLTCVLVFAGCAVAMALTPDGETAADYLPLAALLAVAAIATAPAATLFVLREYDAKGPMTDTILGLTGVNNIVCIAGFYVTFVLLSASGAISSSFHPDQSPLLPLAVTLLGSLVLGVGVGTGISILHSRLPAAETVLIFFAVFIVLGNGEKWLLDHHGMSYNFLLTALFIGAVFSNVALDPDKLEGAIKLMGGPIFAGFFVMAGYGLHMAEIPHLGWVGVAYIVCRLGAKYLGGRLGTRWAGTPDPVKSFIGLGLLCQAAVVIGLADYVGHHWHNPLARTFSTVVLGSVVVFELIGPLLVKWAVLRTGEVKAITLLRRPPAPTEGRALTRLTFAALRRTVGLGHGRTKDTTPELTVKHIARTNIRFLRAGATLDEVLHFVESSRYHHFPVIDDDDQLLGLIHFNELRDMMYDPGLLDLVTAVDLVDPSSPVVPIDMSLTELLDVFSDHAALGAIPVVADIDSRRLLGFVEQRDLLHALHRTRVDPR